MHSLFRAIGFIEIILAICVVAILIATSNSNDLSGLMVLYPIFAMFIVAIFGIIAFVIHSSIKHGDSNSKIRLSRPTKLWYLIFLGLPVFYLSGFSGSDTYSYLVLLSLVLLGFSALYGDKNIVLKIIPRTMMVIVLTILINHSGTLNDTNIYNFTVWISGLIILSLVISLFLVLMGRRRIKT